MRQECHLAPYFYLRTGTDLDGRLRLSFVQERNRQIARDGSIAPRQAWMDAHYRRIALWRFTGLQLALYDLSQNLQETSGHHE
jgi:hypothetical protein